MEPGHSIHIPVMPKEVLQWLEPQAGSVVVDGTVGAAGHAQLLAQAVGPQGLLIALDRDPAALARSRALLEGYPVQCVQANYCALPEVLLELKISTVDGILLDLGISSDQLSDAERGFSFDSMGTLDLRFDPGHGEPAWKLLETLDVRRLADLIYQYGEERFSRRIARKIVAEREREPIRTASQLATLVRKCVPRSGRIDPATRTFQALRIAVNDELVSLEQALQRFPECMPPGARLVVISFQSLEDRRVKHMLRDDERWKVLTKKPQTPEPEEVRRNPRARSAKLRAAERTHC